MIKAIIFDLDNTLFDFMKMKKSAIDAAIIAMIDAGLPLSIEESNHIIDEIYQEKGMEFQQVFDIFLERAIKKIDYKILSTGVVAYRRAREAALTPYRHVYSTLVQLIKRGIKLGILSDAPIREAWLRLAYMNLHHFFDFVVTSGEVGERKPNPAPFNKMLENFDVNPNEALMVGDWVERDVVGASNVGIKTAWAKYGDTFNTSEHNADYVLQDFSELLLIIDSDNHNK